MHGVEAVEQSGCESRETLEPSGVPSDPRGPVDLRRRMELDEVAAQRRFKQHAAVAVIFAMAALTLVIIVRISQSP